MKFLVFSVLILAFAPSESSFKEARLQADREGKPLLLIFSGSDWCRPCIQFKANVLDGEPFVTHAEKNWVVFVADLPRNTNILPAAQLEENRNLATMYNADGAFPHLVLFKNGKVVKSISGGFSSFEDLKAWVESE